MKKLVSIVLALALVLASCAVAFAADPEAFATGSITVEHAAKGETYYAIKAMSAIVSKDGITYGAIPTELQTVFAVKTVTESGRTYETVGKIDGVTDAQVQAAMRLFADNHMPSTGGIECTGNSVKFEGLEPGYYVIVSTLNNKATNKVSAGSTYNGDSVTPHTADGVVYEKNETIPQPVKTVGDRDYSIGDTITYTVKFPGANYLGEGKDSKIVTKYEISDTLPNFLSNAHVQSITIKTNPATSITGKDFDNKKFVIDWAAKDANGKWYSLYPNGTEVEIVYTATLTDLVHIGGKIVSVPSLNINTVTVQPYVDDGGEKPWNEHWDDEEEIRTYAAALKKIDEAGNPLAGAKFKVTGLTATEGKSGVYTVTKYDPSTITLENSTEMTVNDDGMIYIIGLDSAKTLTITETEAPAGYNKLTSTETLTTEVFTTEIYKLTGYREYDAKGNIIAEGETAMSTAVTKNLDQLNAKALSIINNKGTELPHTGGIGTTIFYILGGLLVIGAAVILVARRKAQD